jgi:dynein heavy chain
VLGNSDPTSIQEHILKLFDNCAALQFGDKNKTVIGMRSAEGETYQYRLKVSTDGAVEGWMKSVEAEMRHTLFEIFKEGTYYYAKSIRSDWIYDNLGMVTLVSCHILHLMGIPHLWVGFNTKVLTLKGPRSFFSKNTPNLPFLAQEA